MSVKIMAMVWDADLPRDTKYVLLAYADHADHSGNNVYPSVALISYKTQYSARSVQRMTRKLEEMGILVGAGTGPNGVNKWRIDTALLPKRPGYNSKDDDQGVTQLCQGDKLSGVTQLCQEGVTQLWRQGVHSYGTQTVINHQSTIRYIT